MAKFRRDEYINHPWREIKAGIHIVFRQCRRAEQLRTIESYEDGRHGAMPCTRQKQLHPAIDRVSVNEILPLIVMPLGQSRHEIKGVRKIFDFHDCYACARLNSSLAARRNLSETSAPPSIRAISSVRSPGSSCRTRLRVEPLRSSFST